MILTKQTVINWDVDFWNNFPANLRNFYLAKAAIMKNENKTDDIQYSNVTGIGIRRWTDTSSANEWIQEILLNFSIGDGKLISYEIQDI